MTSPTSPLMQYEIIATLGPATELEATLKALPNAGVTGFRLNTSHLSLVDLRGWLEKVLRIFGDPLSLPLVLDLQGSKWRLGHFPAFVLREGTAIELIRASETVSGSALPIPHPDFFQAVRACSGEIVLNDAKCVLRIDAAAPERVRATVIKGGEISPNKGITLAGSEYRRESLSEKDEQVFAGTRDWPGLRYALSYVKDAAEMANYRKVFGASAHLIAKLERASALQDAQSIARHANELWLCRGDLGAELGPSAMAKAVHGFSKRLGSLPLPVLLAGQVLEHMAEHASPTRSELC
jgi:pyruvate kinase